jgi:predicted negative regulator of RcsB-dependent stress response
MSKLSKHDAFLDAVDKSLAATMPFRKQLTFLILAVIVGGFCWAGYAVYQEKKEDNAQTALFLIEKKAIDMAQEKQKAKDEKDKAALAKEKDPKAAAALAAKNKAAKSAEEEAELKPDSAALLPDYEAFLKAHGNSHAAATAVLQMAQIYDELGQKEKAYEVLNTYQNKVESSDLLTPLFFYRLGIGAEKLGKCDQAIQSWERILKNPKAAFLHAETMLQKGLCLEQLGKKDEAKAAYTSLENDYADTDAGKSAQKYLRWMEHGG